MFRKFVDVHENGRDWERLPRPKILGPARSIWAISAVLHLAAIATVVLGRGAAQQRIRERLEVDAEVKVGNVTPEPIADSTLATVTTLFPLAVLLLLAVQGWLIWRIGARRSKGARSMYFCAVISVEFIAIAGADVMLRGTLALPVTYAATVVAGVTVAMLVTGRVNDWLPTDTQELRRQRRRTRAVRK